MKLIDSIPKTLLDDFAESRVVPMVGAGFSKNAILPRGCSMPDWNQLGNMISKYIPDYEFTNAIDALSLFETQFSRAKLVELLSDAVHLHDVEPGDAHRAFCDLFFDTICTTNFDFLLEHTLQESHRPHSVIVSEDRLSINTREKTKVIKLHGDFNHPERMVITEGDFDLFLEKNKILATYVANIFITKTLLLVGYSFEDVDTRSIWKIIHDRLGMLARPAYVILIGATPIDIARFERRNIKVINLPGKKSNYPQILNQLFLEIKQYVEHRNTEKITLLNENAQRELKLPQENKRLCFVSTPYSRLSYIKDLVFPVLERHGITPITSDEAIMPGESWMVKSEVLIKESSVVIVDISGNNDGMKWELVNVRNMRKQLILIAEKGNPHHGIASLADQLYITYDPCGDNQDFVDCLDSALERIENLSDQEIESEPSRLLQKKEYNAAVISAFRLLEMKLRKHDFHIPVSTNRPMSLSYMVRELYRETHADLVEKILSYIRIRNEIVHGIEMSIDKKTATEIVGACLQLINSLDQATL